MKRILLFDTIIDGHHADYLTHLLTYWLAHPPADELVVVTQASFAPVVEQLTAAHPATAATVRFVPILPSAVDAVHGASPARRSFREWNLLLTYVRAYRPTHALLLYFDIFQVGMALGRSAPCAVSGIYFRPDFHYVAPTDRKARLNVLRKRLLLTGVLRRGTLTNLFCLDHSAVPALRAISPRVNVVPLPDPVRAYPDDPAVVAALRRTLGIGPGRQVFLLFGHLDDRKGIEPLLDALNELPPALHPSVCLLLVGPIRDAYRQQIDARAAGLRQDIQLIRVFEDVKGPQIQAYFDLSDYVLALYQRHVGMASVVVRAAVSGKPVLASDYGYLGQLVLTKQLGLVTDSTAPAAIRALLARVLTKKVPYSAAHLRHVADANSDVAFAQTIFAHL